MIHLLEQARSLWRRVPGGPRFHLLLNRFVYLIYFLLFKTDSFRFISAIPPGHYYSPIPDYKEVLARQQVLFEGHIGKCSGLELQEDAQLRLLESFSRFYSGLPFPETPIGTTRFYYQNDGYLTHADAITLYSVLRYYKPHKVVEVGSGFSSALMLDVNDLF